MLPIIGLLGIVLWPAQSLQKKGFPAVPRPLVKYFRFYLQQRIYLLVRLTQTKPTQSTLS